MNEVVLSTAKVVAPFLGGFFIKSLLEFETAQFLVKWLSWVPTRWLFRNKVTNLKGMWEQEWDVDSSNFPNSTTRHGQTEIKQFFNYCYAEFYAGGEKYIFFGKLNKEYLTGRWYDAKDDNGYFGTHQLVLRNSSEMSGKWLGHSKGTRDVNAGYWSWKKLPS